MKHCDFMGLNGELILDLSGFEWDKKQGFIGI